MLFVLHCDCFHLIALADFIHDGLRIFDDLAENRVLVVEPGRGDVCDEELGAVGIGAGVSHRENAGASVFQVFVKLIGELVARAAGARSLGASALDHEIADHAVESEAVVEAFLGKFFEVGDRFGRLVIVQFEADVAVFGFDGGGFHG
jgi:hypothetical protein